MATAMVVKLGMSPAIGNVGFRDGE